MHFSLSPRFNVLLVIVCAALSYVLFVFSWGVALVPQSVGVVFGIIGGVLQRHSLRATPDAFAAATTALDVRRAFTATASGRGYVALFRGACALFVALPIVYLLDVPQANRGGALSAVVIVVMSFVASALAFTMARDLTTLPWLIRLEAAQRSRA
jgi:hypothetical protein